MFIEGLVTATFFALGPIYGQRLGLDLQDISYFMASAVVGVILFQWPIGALSDKFDRRLILTIVAFLTSGAAYACISLAAESNLVLFVSVGLFAGLALPLYSVCIAHTNDNLEPRQMIAASGTLVLVGGLGAITGPLLVAMSMDAFGNDAFFWCMGAAHAVTGLFALYRMTRRAATPLEKQGHFTPTAMHPSSAVYESMQQVAAEESEPGPD
jgi:MFS family permease